jgi:DNA-binding MarR family transcriptional regulator
LVERERDVGDRRRHAVRLTARDREKVPELYRVATRVNERFIAPLDAGEQAALAAILDELWQSETAGTVDPPA